VQGAHVNVVNISEEKYLATTTHIPSDAFLDLVKFCIAHELFHLIGGTDRPNASGYISGPPPPIPFTEVKASLADIQEVNLPGRFSILP